MRSIRAAFKAAEHHGLTDEEGQRILRMYSFPKRRCDLYQRGMVVDSGLRRDSSYGKPMVVWVDPEFQKGG